MTGSASLVSVVKTSSPRSPYGSGIAGGRIDDLRQEVILEDVQAALVLALDRHARADDLAQAIDVERHEPQLGLDLLAHPLGPGLGAEEADPQARSSRRSTPISCAASAR